MMTRFRDSGVEVERVADVVKELGAELRIRSSHDPAPGSSTTELGTRASTNKLPTNLKLGTERLPRVLVVERSPTGRGGSLSH